jgi:alanyl-tRNA synthetase
MNTRDVRSVYTRFFEERGHRRIPSAALIPANDPTLLFTNAGMVQFKPYFMGLAEPPARRLTTIQKCFRTSDIEEVGDNRHCTFFEMLGNFSVGDYFKPEVIPWAFELLTAAPPQGMGLNKDRIWATIFTDDDESYELWRSVGIPHERIVRYGEEHNYWFAGPVGPCGPNTEINYDFGEYEGWEPHDCHPQCEVPGCRRFIELWNLVFMTLFQAEDGSRSPLPQRNVDTGAGLERWPLPVLWENGIDWQGHPHTWKQPPTIFDVDLLRPIAEHVGSIVGIEYAAASDEEQRAMRVVAEHGRAATFLIADGVTPANDGRGYVLRRLIRRATSFGQRLSQGTQYLESTAKAVIELMGEEHQNLVEQSRFVVDTLRAEEARFNETLVVGRSQLDEYKQRHDDRRIAGAEVFQLWDTHGFPPELTLELLAEEGYGVADPEAFEALMEEQRNRSRAATHFDGGGERIQLYAELGLSPTAFIGYETTRGLAQVSAIVVNGTTVVRELTPELASRAESIELVLDHTPFYAEGGGQVGDQGEIVWPDGRFVVRDTQYVGEGGVVAHIGGLTEGTLAVGDPVEARVDVEKRADTMRNHTGTHILHAALRQVLGSHARQAGSLVTPERLRFDFTHLEALTPEQLRQVEFLANRAVRDNIPVSVEYQSYEDAIAGGALAFFGDKYADTVRVVGVCDLEANQCFSKELCGGTHVHASGDVGVIVITGESSIGAGLRRIEAVTGRAAAERIRQQEETVARLSASLRVPPVEIESRVQTLREENDQLRRQLQAIERRLARAEAEALVSGGGSLAEPGVEDETRFGETAVVVRGVDVPSAEALRSVGDVLKQRYGSAVILLAAVIDDKPLFLAMSTPDVSSRVPAGSIVGVAAKEAGGGGGGRPDLAQGGGRDPAKLDDALAAARKLIEEKLGAS